MQEVLLELESGELSDVPTTKEHFEGIEARLTAIETRLGMSAEIPKPPSFWPKTLVQWFTVGGTLLGVTLYLGTLIVDRHIQTALKPIQTDINRINGDVREIKGMLSVLRGCPGLRWR